MNWLTKLINRINLTPKSLENKSPDHHPSDSYHINLVLAQAEVAAVRAYMRVLSEASPSVLKAIRDRMNQEQEVK